MRVVIAEDEVLLREGLARLLTDSGIQVVATVGTADDALREVAKHRPNVLLADVRMPPTQTDEGLRLAVLVGERHPEVGVLVLSHFIEPRLTMQLLERRSKGAGYLLKDRVGQVGTLVEAIYRVAAGGVVVDPTVVSTLVEKQQAAEALGELSARERELLGLMAEGLSNSAISERLVLSDKTVETHIRAVFTKLGLPPARDDSRRVLAVLKYLRATASYG
ncbi:MAG TPA: response regulator transcription factor [Nocardioidaceae bacterium]|nr:response regulator transcription factor [Nocardioidaceae bacterium]